MKPCKCMYTRYRQVHWGGGGITERQSPGCQASTGPAARCHLRLRVAHKPVWLWRCHKPLLRTSVISLQVYTNEYGPSTAPRPGQRVTPVSLQPSWQRGRSEGVPDQTLHIFRSTCTGFNGVNGHVQPRRSHVITNQPAEGNSLPQVPIQRAPTNATIRLSPPWPNFHPSLPRYLPCRDPLPRPAPGTSAPLGTRPSYNSRKSPRPAPKTPRHPAIPCLFYP